MMRGSAPVSCFRLRAQAEKASLSCDEDFTVDSTILEAWAGLRSIRPKMLPASPPDEPGNSTDYFYGVRRRNDTHASTSDPDARLDCKGKGKAAKLEYLGHALLDNRHGLVPKGCATPATKTVERDAAVRLLTPESRAKAVGGAKNVDVASFVAGAQDLAIPPHLGHKDRGSAIDGSTTRHDAYAIRQCKRTLIEQVFGWMETVGGLPKLRHRGDGLVGWILTFAEAAYNLVRIRTLLARA